MRPAILFTAAALAAALLVPAAAPAQNAPAAPTRHLVYAFTWGSQSDLEVRDSGVSAEGGASGGSGISDFRGGESDQGTIAVDVVREQPDKGLILDVSETAQHTHNAAVARCVAYGNTSVICDPNKTVYPEELTLLRFLASNFVDPNQLDSQSHWKVVSDSGAAYSMVADYTIAKNADGVMTIDEKREVKQTQAATTTTDITTTIDYDFNRTIPTSVNEYTIARQAAGMSQYQTVKSQTVLRLQSDSAKP